VTEKQSGDEGKSKDEKLQDMISLVVDKAFEAAKVMTKVGIKGAFAAKDLSDKVDSGQAEQALKDGVKETEKIVRAAARVAKKHFLDFLNELAPDEEDVSKKT